MQPAKPNKKHEVRSVALYARVSTKDGRQDTENQLIVLREYCQKMNWSITEEYVDHETGTTSKRRNFQRMLADARVKKFDLVLFWAMDRFSREGPLETLKYLEKLNSYDVYWRSHTEEYLDSCGPFKEVVLSLFAMIAQQESVRRSERAHAGVAKARRLKHALGRHRKVVDMDKVRQLRASGKKLRELANMFRVGTMTISRIIKAGSAAA